MTTFTDGEWHRLHPATPFLRGGLTLVAIVGIVVVNLRDILIDQFFGRSDDDGDPLLWVTENGYAGLALIAVLVFIALLVAGFYVSWRMHTFRITDEVVEVRSGILFRTNRKARLDRVQGINIQRPFLARLFGAARLEVNVAGNDANVKLDYLSSAAADELRLEILRLASGSTDAATVVVPGSRLNELLAPELDPSTVKAVVSMHLGRLLGAIILSESTLVLVALIAGPIVFAAITGEPIALVVIFPSVIGMGSFVVRRFTKSLRYTISSTDDGIRIGYGLLSTSNETLPPGRIHAVEVSQPLLWRIGGWWEIKINRASTSQANGAAGQANTTILPVGNLDEVTRVLELLLPGFSPELLHAGLLGGGPFTNSPPRARVVRWFSVKRNGYALIPGAVLFRRGAIWRSLTVVPLARAQSVTVEQGPLERRLRLAMLRVHTVTGPVTARLGAVDVQDASAFFDAASVEVVASATNDTAHRWRQAPA